MKYLLYIAIFLFPFFESQAHSTTIIPPKTEISTPQSSTEIVRQLIRDYEKFIKVIRTKSANRSRAYWMKQNRKFERLETRRANLKEVLGDEQRKKLKKWGEEYRENAKHWA